MLAGISVMVAATSQETRFKILVWTGIFLITLLIAAFVRENSYFIADDYDHFIQAGKLPLLDFLATPIDVHYAPLHKLFSALILKLAPLNFDMALAVLLIFHGFSVYMLYRLLQELRASRLNLLIVFVYASNIFVFHPLLWWSAGIHRFPYILLSIVSLYSYVRYRRSRSIIDIACCYLAFALAFGFYSKAVLIPAYILGLELCLSWRQGLHRLVERFWLGCSMLLVSLAYVIWYLEFSTITQQGPSASIEVALQLIFQNFKVLAVSLLFCSYTTPSLEFNWALVLFFIGCTFGGFFKVRAALLPWSVLLALLFLNFAVIAASGRGQMFAEYLAFILRYYFEIMFIVAIFFSLIASAAQEKKIMQMFSMRSYNVVFSFCLVYALIALWFGSAYFHKNYGDSYRATAGYMHNLITGLSNLPRSTPVLFSSAGLPSYVYGAFTNEPMPMEKILPLRYPNMSFVPREQAQYEVDETGNVTLKDKSEI